MGSNFGLPYPTETIDREESLHGVEITFDKISSKGGTFRTYSDGKDRLGRKKYRSRSGVQTEYGDIEENLWCKLVKKLIEDHQEIQLFQHLKAWVIKECRWLGDKQEVERYTLELHALRIFDNPYWVDYVAFNQKYRPQVLENVDLVWVINERCNEPQRIARKKMEADNSSSFHCHICGKWREYKPTEYDK